MKIEDKRMEQTRMKRVWAIYMDYEYQSCLRRTMELEQNRLYCGHDFEHFMSVARLAYLFSLERGYGLEKELIYALALLHDIGRWKEYEDGTSHDVAGAEIAGRILERCDFSLEEKEMILSGILSHRGDGSKDIKAKGLSQNVMRFKEVLYDADKMSRKCFCCENADTCNWSDEKKNLRILW